MQTARRSLAALTLALALVASASPRPASASTGGDTTAVAINTRDGSSIFRLAFNVRRVMDSTVDSGNYAVAVASCTDCQTVAISFQIVLVMSDPDVFTPENMAIAMNIDCQSCSTMAQAYQFVIGGGGDTLKFDAEGNRRLAELRRRLQELRQSDIAFDQIQQELDAMAAEIADILANNLIAISEPAASPTTEVTTTTPTVDDTSTTSTSAPDGASTTSSTSTSAP
jgi:putative peptide zinc metalloprotease protein